MVLGEIERVHITEVSKKNKHWTYSALQFHLKIHKVSYPTYKDQPGQEAVAAIYLLNRV
jgi:hypothetical protein